MDDLKEINTENVLMFQYCAYLYPGEHDESGGIEEVYKVCKERNFWQHPQFDLSL